MFITKKDGSIPSESEGMSKLIMFFNGLRRYGGNVDHVTIEPDEINIIHHVDLEGVFYNPKTGEFGIDYDHRDKHPESIVVPFCGAVDVCTKGCGCKCWVDKGFEESCRFKNTTDPHCKDLI